MRVKRVLLTAAIAMAGGACHHPQPTVDLSCDQLQFNAPGPRSGTLLRVGSVRDSTFMARGEGRLVVRVWDLADSGAVISEGGIMISREGAPRSSVAIGPSTPAFSLAPGSVLLRVHCLRCAPAVARATIVSGRTDTLDVRVARSRPVCERSKGTNGAAQ